MSSPAICVLGLEVRCHRLGFAVLEDRNHLLEFGTENYSTARNILLCVVPLLALFEPDVVVIRVASHRNPRQRRKVEAALRVIHVEAESRSMAMARLTANEISSELGLTDATKDEIAAAVARRLPELHWKLPTARKPWTSESYNMAIFDAAAAALAFCIRAQDVTGQNREN